MYMYMYLERMILSFVTDDSQFAGRFHIQIGICLYRRAYNIDIDICVYALYITIFMIIKM
jgi:hypothetical protein